MFLETLQYTLCMTSTTSRQRIFRTDIPILNRTDIPHTNTKQKQKRNKLSFSEHQVNSVFTCVAQRCRVIVFQAVSFKLPVVFPEQNSFPLWQLCSKFTSDCHPKRQDVKFTSVSERLILAKPIDSWWVLFYYASQRYVSYNAQIFFLILHYSILTFP